MSATGLLLIAGVGLLKNGGLGVNNDLKTEVERFSTSGVSGSVQAKIAGASTEVIDELRRAPSFLTGILPDGVSINGRTDITNIPQAVLDQGKSLFAPPANPLSISRYADSESSVATFTSVYSAASGYSAQTFGFQGSIAQASGQKFDDLGFQFKNYNDVVSGGVTSQFDPAGIPALSKELTNFGTLFNTSDLARIADPVALTKNLIDQGLGQVGDLQSKIEQEEIDLSDDFPDEVLKERTKSVLQSISGSDLDEIFEVTNFSPARRERISTLADVLDINNLFSEEALVALGDNPSLEGFSNKMSNIGGKFSSTTSIGSFLGSLDLRSFPTLAGLSTLLPTGLMDGLGNIMGKGTGIFGNPTVNDMTASASGLGYVSDIRDINNLQSSLLEFDSDIVAFKQYLDTTDTVTVEELSGLIDAILSKPQLADDIAGADAKMLKCAERLDIEKINLSAAGITPGATASNNSGLMNFSSNLHGLGVDPMNLGLGNQLTGMAQPGLAGDAISASLVEGKNLGRMAVFGITPNTKMDPMAYAKNLTNMA